MPDFMELLAKGIKDSRKVLLSSIQSLASSVGTTFTGLSVPQMGTGQLAVAGGGAVTNNRTVNMGGVTVHVNGYNSKNDSDLADAVVRRINEMLDEGGSVWK